MTRVLFTIPFLILTFFAYSQQRIPVFDEKKIIEIIYPTYFADISGSGWVKYFDEDHPAEISEIVLYPIGTDTSQTLVIMTWSSNDYVLGNVSEFFVIKRQDTSFVLVAGSINDDHRLFYGGGTQRFGEPTILNSQLNLSDSILGFTISLGSHHFASQTEMEEFYLFAIINQEIRLVLNTGNKRYSEFSLKKMKEEPHLIEDFLSKIDEYIPNELYKKNIFEKEMSYDILNSQTLGMRNILLNEEMYSLVDKKIKMDQNHHYYQWNGEKYTNVTVKKYTPLK